MPFVRISVPSSLDDDALRHVSNAVHDSMVACFNVPPKDRFQVLSRHAAGELVCTPDYLDIAHTGPVAFVQITCNAGRSLEMKKELYRRIAASVAEGGVIRASDVIINLVEVAKENWSFGNGVAQYAT